MHTSIHTNTLAPFIVIYCVVLLLLLCCFVVIIGCCYCGVVFPGTSTS